MNNFNVLELFSQDENYKELNSWLEKEKVGEIKSLDHLERRWAGVPSGSGELFIRYVQTTVIIGRP